MGLNRSKRTDQHLATLIWLQSRRAAKASEAMAADAKKERPLRFAPTRADLSDQGAATRFPWRRRLPEIVGSLIEAATMVVSDERRSVVLYDADCGFCRWSLAKLLGWDRHRRLRPVAIQSLEGERLLADLDEDKQLASWHLVDRAGRRHSGGTAAVPLLRALPAGRQLAALAERFPGETERSYKWITRHRGTLGRLIPAGAKRRADARLREREARYGPQRL
jgi:predicted DCC family thiol-disulfide oxidoreductase YuxK